MQIVAPPPALRAVTRPPNKSSPMTSQRIAAKSNEFDDGKLTSYISFGYNSYTTYTRTYIYIYTHTCSSMFIVACNY